MERLAIDGGEPARKRPFPTAYVGVSFYGDEELNELRDVIAEKSPFRHYGVGTPVKAALFEADAREYFGRRFALAVSSGSAALFCAVAAIGAGRGDEVILPAFNWFSDYYAITHLGALPVFADVDETLSIDPVDFERKITERTKAVIAVSFQGCPANLTEIERVAAKYGIKVIDDFAQSIGASRDGRRLGSFGDISVASFQQNKIISCGEGGIFLTDDENFFARAVRYHDLGSMRGVFKDQLGDKDLADPARDFAGHNFRMSELQAAVMVAQLRRLDMMIGICRTNHERLRERFASNRRFVVRHADGECGVTFFMLFKSKQEAARFGECLAAEGVPLGATSACKNLLASYPVKSKKMPHDSLPPFGAGFDGEHAVYDSFTSCPNTDGFVGRYVAVAVGPQFTESDIDDLITAIEKVDRLLAH